MDPQWQAYQDFSMNRPIQFGNGLVPHPQQQLPKYSGQPQYVKPPVSYNYEPFHTPTSSKPPSVAPSTKPIPMASMVGTPRSRDYVTDVDTAMEDADPYNRAKYTTRTGHASRPSSQYLPSEESSAARRYSPMNALSPPSSYNPVSPAKSQNSYAFPVRQNSTQWSPTRAPTNYSSPPQAYQSPSCEYSFMMLHSVF